MTFNAIFSKLIATSFSFINELNETSREKVTLQKLSCSTNDQSAFKNLNGLELPVIDIVFIFLLTDTLVTKFSVANLKFINKILFKRSINYNVEDLLGNKLDLKNPRLFKLRIDRIVYSFTYNEFMQIVNTSLFNYQEPLSEIDEFICLEYILIKPLDIKNPYTNRIQIF